MRGRKPVPTGMKVLRGNPGHRTVETTEPKLPAGAPPRPDFLTGDAADEWTRRVTELYASGIATRADWATLAMYCYYFGQWSEAVTKLAEEPQVIRTKSGYVQPNPRIAIRNKNATLMLKAAAELGITPSARSRVKAHSEPPEDEFSEFERPVRA